MRINYLYAVVVLVMADKTRMVYTHVHIHASVQMYLYVCMHVLMYMRTPVGMPALTLKVVVLVMRSVASLHDARI